MSEVERPDAQIVPASERLTGVGAHLARLLRVPPEPAAPVGSPGSLRVFRAAPSYVRYRMVGWLIAHAMSAVLFVLGPTVFALALVVSDEVNAAGAAVALTVAAAALGFWLLLVALGYLTIRVDRDLRWYMVTDRSLRIREGVWFVREMTMTFANIQNVSVSQGPLQRVFGVADLVVQTAGGGGVPQQGQGATSMHMGRFRGIADAQGVRDFVMARMKVAAGAGLGDAAPAAGPQGHGVGFDGDGFNGDGLDSAYLNALRDVAAESARLRSAISNRPRVA